MKTFAYTIAASNGIHARPAGIMVKELSRFASEVTVTSCRGKSASARKLFALMQLGIRQGESIDITVDGADEDETLAFIADFFPKNF